MKSKKLNFFMASGLCLLMAVGGCASKEGKAEDNQTEILDQEESETADSESLGDFSLEDINGETYTPEMFADYDLTMINVFTT